MGDNECWQFALKFLLKSAVVCGKQTQEDANKVLALEVKPRARRKEV